MTPVLGGDRRSTARSCAGLSLGDEDRRHGGSGDAAAVDRAHERPSPCIAGRAAMRLPHAKRGAETDYHANSPLSPWARLLSAAIPGQCVRQHRPTRPRFERDRKDRAGGPCAHMFVTPSGAVDEPGDATYSSRTFVLAAAPCRASGSTRAREYSRECNLGSGARAKRSGSPSNQRISGAPRSEQGHEPRDIGSRACGLRQKEKPHALRPPVLMSARLSDVGRTSAEPTPTNTASPSHPARRASAL